MRMMEVQGNQTRRSLQWLVVWRFRRLQWIPFLEFSRIQDPAARLKSTPQCKTGSVLLLPRSFSGFCFYCCVILWGCFVFSFRWSLRDVRLLSWLEISRKGRKEVSSHVYLRMRIGPHESHRKEIGLCARCLSPPVVSLRRRIKGFPGPKECRRPAV